MANTINNFKVFDENKSNLLTNNEYSLDTQRVNGFSPNDEVPSSLFNSVLRQNSLMSYVGIEYMKQYVSDATIEHTMNASTLQTFISNFFDNLFTSKISTATVSYSNLSLGSRGSIVYSKSGGNALITPPLLLNSRYNIKWNVGYELDLGYSTPAAIQKGYYEAIYKSSFTGAFTALSVGNWKIFSINLSTDIMNDNGSATPNPIMSLDEYEFKNLEVFIELLQGTGTKYYNNIVIPLQSLNALYYYSTPEPSYSVNDSIFIKSPKNDVNIHIGLSNTTSESYSGTIGNYLIMIINSTENITVKNITLRERI